MLLFSCQSCNAGDGGVKCFYWTLLCNRLPKAGVALWDLINYYPDRGLSFFLKFALFDFSFFIEFFTGIPSSYESQEIAEHGVCGLLSISPPWLPILLKNSSSQLESSFFELKLIECLECLTLLSWRVFA